MKMREIVKVQWKPLYTESAVIIITVLFFCFLGASSLAIGAGKEKAADPRAGYPNEFSNVSIQSYTKELAKRFGLSPHTGDTPKDGIYALEFRIHQNWSNQCVFNVYLDNKLDLLYPEGDVGYAYLEQHLLKRTSNRGDDNRFINTYEHKYRRKAFLTSEDYVYRKSGFSTSLLMRHYRKYFLPDVALLSLRIPCALSIVQEGTDHLQLWLEKSGGKNYTKLLRVDPEDFYRLRIPKGLYNQFVPYAIKARDKNNKVINMESEIRRKMRQLKSKK